MTNIPLDSYLPSSDYGVEGTFYVVTDDGTKMRLADAIEAGVRAKKLTFMPTEGFAYNRTYTVVLQDKIVSVSGKQLDEEKRITFTSQYGPLFGEQVSEVHNILKGLFVHFSIHEIYVALRDAGQKAYILLKMTPDINSARFRELLDTRTEYFGVTRYVPYEAARILLGALYIRMSEKLNLGDPNSPFVSESQTELGDLNIREKTGDNYIGNSILTTINTMLAEVERQLKYWQDHVMERDRRSYASPITASFRTGNGSPAERGDF